MMIGIYGLIFEFSNPGFVLPGVVGGICLLLALFALQLLPINYAGLGLIVLGLAFIVSEAFLPSFGALGIGGTIALIIGAVMLIEPEAQGYGVSLPFVMALGVTSGVIVWEWPTWGSISSKRLARRFSQAEVSARLTSIPRRAP